MRPCIETSVNFILIETFLAFLLPLAAGSKLRGTSVAAADKFLVPPGRPKTPRLQPITLPVSPPAAASKPHGSSAAAAETSPAPLEATKKNKLQPAAASKPRGSSVAADTSRSLASLEPTKQTKIQSAAASRPHGRSVAATEKSLASLEATNQNKLLPAAASKPRGTSVVATNKSLTRLNHPETPRPQPKVLSVAPPVVSSKPKNIFVAAVRKLDAPIRPHAPSMPQPVDHTVSAQDPRAFVQRTTAHARMRSASRRAPTISKLRYHEPRPVEEMKILWGLPIVVWVILADVVAMASFLACIPMVMHLAKRRRPEMGNPGAQNHCCPCLHAPQKPPMMQGHPGMGGGMGGGYAMGGAYATGGGGHGGYGHGGGGHGGYAPPPRPY